MVIGGYGQVGNYVSSKLNDVVVAGRNQEKADLFIKENHIKGYSRCIDTRHLKREDFTNINTVIMCVESNNLEVLQACIRYKINYIDISPSYEILAPMLEFKEQIQEEGISCVIGVGIAPGVSNLLCKEASKDMDEVKTIDSYLMLGVGEQHGKNAILWFLQHIYSNTEGIDSFHKTKRIMLHRKKGVRKQTMTMIDLADCHIMQQEYKNAICQSWFAYDINWTTKMVCFLKKVGVFKSLVSNNQEKREKAYKRFQKLLHIELSIAKLLHIGTDEYVSQVQVTGVRDGKEVNNELWVNGECNSKITAYAAVAVANKIENLPSGLHYIDQVIDLGEIHSI